MTSSENGWCHVVVASRWWENPEFGCPKMSSFVKSLVEEMLVWKTRLVSWEDC